MATSKYIDEVSTYIPFTGSYSDLTSDTNYVYTRSAGRFVVSEGDYIQVGGGDYFEVAASDASDQDFTTSGGVKMYEAGPNFSSRAKAVAWKARIDAASKTIKDGTKISDGLVGYVIKDGTTAFSGFPDLAPDGQYDQRHWGVVVGDSSEATSNVTAINAAMTYIEGQGGGSLHVPEGVTHCSGTVNWSDKVALWSTSTRPAVRPAPSTIGASTPAGILSDEGGALWLFSGAPTRNITIDNVSSNTNAGFGRDMDSSHRPWNNSYDARMDLLDLTNADASGATRATLKSINAAVRLTGDKKTAPKMSNVRIALACDGVTSGGGTSLAGYEIDNAIPDTADYDVGLLVESPWQGRIDNVQVYGYWKLRGMIVTSMEDDNPLHGYAEVNTFKDIFVQGGTAIRSGDICPVLSKTASSITIEWWSGHRFETSGSIRVGDSFADYETLSYTGLTYTAGSPNTLEFTGISDTSSVTSKADNSTSFDAIVTTGGAGTAGTKFVGSCYFCATDHTSKVPEPGLSLPYRAAMEVSGCANRYVTFIGATFNTISPVAMALGFAEDIGFIRSYSEVFSWRTTTSTSTYEKGGVWISGDVRADNKVGQNFRHDVLEIEETAHIGVNRSPYLRCDTSVSSTFYFNDWNTEDLFNIRSHRKELGNDGTLDLLIDGLRDQDVRLGTKQTDGSFQEHIKAFNSGATGLGQQDTPGSSGTLRSAMLVGGESVSYGAQIRRDLTIETEGTDDALMFDRNASGTVTEVGKIRISSLGLNIHMNSSDVTISVGSGTPEGTVTAAVGSLRLRTDGGAGTSLYVKESGTGNTGWVAK